MLLLSLSIDELKPFLSAPEFEFIQIRIQAINGLVERVNKMLQEDEEAPDDVSEYYEEVDKIYKLCTELNIRIQRLLKSEALHVVHGLLAAIGSAIEKLIDVIKAELDLGDGNDNVSSSSESSNHSEEEDEHSFFLMNIAAALSEEDANTSMSDGFIEAFLDLAREEETYEDFNEEQDGPRYLNCIALLNSMPMPSSWDEDTLGNLFDNLVNILDKDDSKSLLHLYDCLLTLQKYEMLDFKTLAVLVDFYKDVRGNGFINPDCILTIVTDSLIRSKKATTVFSSSTRFTPQAVNHPNQVGDEQRKRSGDAVEGLEHAKRVRGDEKEPQQLLPVWHRVPIGQEYYYSMAEQMYVTAETSPPPAAAGDFLEREFEPEVDPDANPPVLKK